jgi:hypothetical protein
MAIDLVLVTIPLQILKRAKLKVHERKLLKMIFSATLLGTMTLYVFLSTLVKVSYLKQSPVP